MTLIEKGCLCGEHWQYVQSIFLEKNHCIVIWMLSILKHSNKPQEKWKQKTKSLISSEEKNYSTSIKKNNNQIFD